ncbi:D-sedoheptulose-7-phosphate isomerase [Azospirillum halopraeferens]|uniref:D-sedoheptulose-7-phosphate isomerase n=1 Tax=Azospirillum halopraeferens TaxID=34010 RepID=UPI0004286755|nr:SIS domain-containing protein [Azospirillum halopraeferens]
MTAAADALAALYPDDDGADGGDGADALLASVRRKADDHLAVVRAFIDGEAAGLLRAAGLIADAYARGGQVLTMGNGGSSCDAAHLAVEFVHPVTTGRPALPAVDLGADTAMLTAVGNDVGFDHVFVRQVLARGRPGDALVGFSTSGNSANLLAAFDTARRRGIVTIGFTGGDGGAMARAVDVCLVVPTRSIHRVQEVHLLAYHILWDLVHTRLAGRRPAPPQEATP